jgi:hypothetical protein
MSQGSEIIMPRHILNPRLGYPLTSHGLSLGRQVALELLCRSIKSQIRIYCEFYRLYPEDQTCHRMWDFLYSIQVILPGFCLQFYFSLPLFPEAPESQQTAKEYHSSR